MAEQYDLRRELVFRKSKDVKKNTPTPGKDGLISKNSVHKVYELKDYVWAEDSLDYSKNSLDTSILSTTPKMIATEFQPFRSYNWDRGLKELAVGKAAEWATSLLSKTLTPADTAAILRDNKDKLPTWLANITDRKNFLFGGEGRSALGGTAMRFIKELLSGKFLGAYEIPFFSDAYLLADNVNGWQDGGSARVFGDSVMQILQEGFEVNFPVTPVWKKSENPLNFQYEFYLINNGIVGGDGVKVSSTDNLVKNFGFLNALASGNYWSQVSFTQQSPNLWDIEVPGRFHKHFCAMGVEITFAGKCRQNAAAVDLINSKVGSDDDTIQKKINLAGDTLFPDAYKIAINVRDLTPNNFNAYLDYLHHGNKVRIASEQEAFGRDDLYTIGIGKKPS